MVAVTTPDAAANPKKQKRTEKAASGNVKKPRASPPAKQSNTLDMWFKKAAPKAPVAAIESSNETKEKDAQVAENADSNSDTAPAAPIEELTKVTPPVQKKKVMNAASSSSKKLVQRRIHINDPCRVCESARTEDVSRCELRCLGCDMTVHKKCYDVESEEPIDDWHCRRCEHIASKKEELKSTSDVILPATASDSDLLPIHEPLGEMHKHYELHSDSDFATVFQFLKRFRRMGLKISLDINLKNLADALTDPTATKFIEELQLRLLVNIEATISKSHDWTASLAKFLASAEHRPLSTKLDAFVASASTKKDQSVDATCAKLYAALSVSERVVVLKFLCEAQFDDNEALVERIGDQEGDSLRDEPVGTDSCGRTYWALEDPPSVLEGTVWLCRCASVKESSEESSSVWETVTDDLETLESLIEWLSLSSETADLQLWQQLSSGILKSLVRRTKKQQQSAARLARMPRLLGGVSSLSSSGFDLGSVMDDDGFGVRRSARSRRTVSYRVAESEEEEEQEEEEEEANESGEEEDDDEEENDDEKSGDEDDERPSKRPRRAAGSQQQGKPKRSEPEPSRRSSRLRGGDGDDNDDSLRVLHDGASSPSPPRRRSDRRVAADARSSSRSQRSTRRTATAAPEDSQDDTSSSSEEEEHSRCVSLSPFTRPTGARARTSSASPSTIKLSDSLASRLSIPMLPTVISSDDGPLLSAFGEIVHRGWLNLKTRSMVNMRPRHMRYCILAKDSHLLSTFKFQPSTGDLQSGNVKPLKSYKVLGVAPWDGRRFAFLVSAVQISDNGDRVLEVDAPVAQAASEWIHHLRVLTNGADNWPPAAPTLASLGNRSFGEMTSSTATTTGSDDSLSRGVIGSKRSDMWVKGASVHRGLLNASGENSCFLNVIIQSFWHLTSMRHFLLHVEIKDGSRTVEANVLRALKSIMMEYDDTTSGMIHSRGLRKGMSVLYAADKNFQEGAMYDAEETLLALLNLMHQQTDATDISETQKTTQMVKSLVRLVSVDTPSFETEAEESMLQQQLAVFDENSIPHLVFSHQIYDRYICGTCRHTMPWDLYSNLIFTTYASDLCGQQYDTMEQMMRHISLQEGDVAPSCDVDNCGGKHVKERVIHRFPMVFAMSVLWATTSATKEQVHGLLSNIADRVDLAKCFDASGPAIRFKNGGIRTTYRLRGLVCYYGRHYVALFYSTAHKMWLLFDDSRVIEVGSWQNVISECLRGRFQPVLFFYELPDQRKDSSISLLSMSDLQASEQRRKSHSFTEMHSQSIQESPDEEDLPSPRKKQLLSVEEETPGLFANGSFVGTTGTSEPQEAAAAVTMMRVEGDREFEMKEMTRRNSISRINITPVSAAIAMLPRTISMNSVPGEGEYDVMFGDDTVVLGMYLEKIGSDLCVTSFPRGVNDELFGAEKSGQICLFDLVLLANGHPLQHYQVDRALKMIKAQSRPLVIRFRRSVRVQSLLDMGFSSDVACEALVKTNGDIQAAANLCFEMRR